MQQRSLKYTGVIWSILFTIFFLIIDNFFYPLLYGWQWSLFTSIQRIIFGIIQLFLWIKIFKKTTLKEVINFKGFLSGVKAGFGVLIYTAFWFFTYLIIGPSAFQTVPIVQLILNLVLVQIATGFWEEINFRLYVLDGYFTSNQTVKNRFFYAILSGVIFGVGHAISCETFMGGIERFLMTGIWGFVFASVYLYSKNILSVMILHFVTDVFFNAVDYVSEWKNGFVLQLLDNYVRFVVLGIVIIVAIYYLKKEPKG